MTSVSKKLKRSVSPSPAPEPEPPWFGTLLGKQNTLLHLQNKQKITVLEAFSREVNVFLHCHLRGYDKTGRGEEMYAEYFDKYGAPLSMHESWVEGYREVEKQLALHFDKCANPKNKLPLIAGYGGGSHLYKPVKLHDVKPWDMTGWVPLENMWLCQNNFFKNRHFFCLRGNEIQNDLWDYHPYIEDWTQDNTDAIYSQYVPLGPYLGGYWFEHDVRARYLHIMALKSHSHNNEGNYDRYNYIVHPLAYRKSVASLPDNSVDGMQWSITNIVNEPHFNSPKTWGDKCHGIEIFNDFTYFYSWQPEDDGIFNGTKMNYTDEQKKTRYHYWFNTYPLEFGEFLLDSALTFGTYLHPISANDAFYNRTIVPFNEQTVEERADAEGMERVLQCDPKGFLIKRLEQSVVQEGCSKESGVRRSAIKSFTARSESMKELQESIQFLKDKPYGDDTVFGYVTILDYKMDFKHTYIEIKKKNSISDGSRHRLFEVSAIRNHCDESEKNIVQKVVQDNGFYAHPEHIILAMLGDERIWVRERAVKIIGEIRSFLVKGIRSFFKPLLNFNAEEIWELCYKSLCTMKRRKCMENSPPATIVQKGDVCTGGLNLVEHDAINKLRDGQFFGHTGVFDFLEYSKARPIPFSFPLQKDHYTMDNEIKNKSGCIFTFPPSKAKTCPLRGTPKKPLIWRYMIQTVVDREDRSVMTTYGYFMMSTEMPTQLNLLNYSINDVCWIRFTAFDSQNPQKRAWFPAVRGPAFAKSAKTYVDIADVVPKMTERIMTTKRSISKKFCVVKEDQEFAPTVIPTSTLDLCFDRCSYEEQNDIFAYFFQSYPIKQPLNPNDCQLRSSKLSETKPDEPFASRIIESVHGYFQLCDDYPTRINLTKSWDENSVVDKQVYVYRIDDETAQPMQIQHLVLDNLPECCFPEATIMHG